MKSSKLFAMRLDKIGSLVYNIKRKSKGFLLNLFEEEKRMQLLFYIPADSGKIPPLLSALMEADVHGATVIPCEGMLHAINDSSVEPPPIFGSLRQFLNPAGGEGKILMLVLPDSRVDEVKELVTRHAGALDRPNTGILFTVPINFAAGVAEN